MRAGCIERARRIPARSPAQARQPIFQKFPVVEILWDCFCQENYLTTNCRRHLAEAVSAGACNGADIQQDQWGYE